MKARTRIVVGSTAGLLLASCSPSGGGADDVTVGTGGHGPEGSGGAAGCAGACPGMSGGAFGAGSSPGAGGGGPAPPGGAGPTTGGANGGGTPSSDGTDAGSGGTTATGGSAGNSDCEDEIVGWATVDGGTTGGEGGEVVTVTDASALEEHASGVTPKVIRISGTIPIPRLEVGSNKTLLGDDSDATLHGGVLLDGSVNVVIKNLRIDGSATDVEDAVTITGESHHVWVDHCSIFDAPDGNLDVVHGSDYVTVSWTHFYYSRGGDHRFSNLVGHSDDNAEEDEDALRVTFHHDWWGAGVVERMPRVRFGQVHSFNNYFSSGDSNYCIRAAKASEVLIESNYFDGVDNPHEIDNEDGSPARVVALGNAYEGGTTGATDTNGTVFDPPYDYVPSSATDVPARVTRCAGPR